MMILGLTGSIGMGKSATADIFRRLRVPVHDADAAVHALMGPDGQAFDAIAKRFPMACVSGRIDRRVLGALVFDDAEALQTLEGILHPLVRETEAVFLKRCALEKRKVVLLDIPLLFETNGESRCDAVCVVTAPAFIQRQRVMARPDMTDKTFQTILAKQMPDVEKRELADFIIHTGLGRRRAFTDVLAILDEVSGLKGWHWPRRPNHFRP